MRNLFKNFHFYFQILILLFHNINATNKLFQTNYCPNEYNTICKCISNTDVSTDELQTQIDCKLINEENVNFKIIPKINTSNYQFIDHITEIDLSHTAIHEISTDSFRGLNALRTITITKCDHLKHIRMFAFRGLKSLQKLIITNNKQLIRIDAYAFGSLRNVNYLSLSMNNLNNIDGYIFSGSISIHTIDFLGNPIKTIKSFAFNSLRNVSELIISKTQMITHIETIEADSFISTAFVDHIYLQGINTVKLQTNSFRGLSNCKSLDISNSYIEEIEANAFYHTINIDLLNISYSQIKVFHKNAFSGMQNVKSIDLRGNYISKLNKTTFSPLFNDIKNMDEYDDVNTVNNNNKKLYFENNPIQCDCSLKWVFSTKYFQTHISLPEICAGPKGYDCLSINDFKDIKLECNLESSMIANTLPCDRLVFPYTANDTESSTEDSGSNTETVIIEPEYVDDYVSTTTDDVSSNFMAKTTTTTIPTIIVSTIETTLFNHNSNNRKQNNKEMNIVNKKDLYQSHISSSAFFSKNSDFCLVVFCFLFLLYCFLS